METVNQEVKETIEGKTFTQAELDAIVSDRLKRDRAKYADYEELKAKAGKLDEIEEASKSELQKATERAAALQTELDSLRKAEELRNMRDSIAAELGVPAVLLTAETEEACRTQAEAVLNLTTNQKGYPTVRDGGEVSGPGKASPKQQFADWANEVFN